MSVLAVMTADEAIAPLLQWSQRLAESRGEPLVLFVLLKGPGVGERNPLELEIESRDELVEEVRLAALGLEAQPLVFVQRSSEFEASILEILEERSASLLVVGKRESEKPEQGEPAWRTALLGSSPCDTMLLRPGSDSGGRCNSILVPLAGGPHAPVALRLAEGMASGDIARVTALTVMPDVDDAELVGMRRITKLLKSAGLSESERIVPRVLITSKSPFEGITEAASEGFDLVLLGASEQAPVKRILFGTVPQRLMDRREGTSVAILRCASPLHERAREALDEWIEARVPQVTRDERVDLFERLDAGSRGGFDFYAMTGMATAIASLGLIQNSPAVVIGAMLVAPLMTPMIGAGLSLVQGNQRLMRESAYSICYGFLLALSLGLVIGFLSGATELTPELAARGKPGLLDMAVAILSGMAAAYAQARPSLSGALPGVAIAAALVPPIATGGISLSMGSWANAEGAVALFVTNLVLIVLGAAISLYAIGVRGNREHSKGKMWTRRVIAILIFASIVIAFVLRWALLAKV